MNIFSTFHPLVLSFYYSLVVLIVVLTQHPIVAIIALLGSLAYFSALKGWIFTIKEVMFYSFIFLLLFLVYPTFVHNGYTPLFFLNDQPVTLEAIMKGTILAVMIVAVCFWTKSYFEIFTTDKILFLFTRISARLAIFMSMLLRFIPIFKEQWRQKQLAQKTIGYYAVQSKVEQLQRFLKLWVHTLIFSIEFVFFKPDVMRSRGYGTKTKRTQFSMIHYMKKDYVFLLFMVCCFGFYLFFKEHYHFYYYPKLRQEGLNLVQITMIAILMLLPAMYEMKENAKWIYLKSKM